MNIRFETASDADAITEITKAAFTNHSFSRNTEHVIVKALRAAGMLSVSLVAVIDGKVVGHIAFSPVTIAFCPDCWHAMGPVSVSPALQRKGIGSALVREGLTELRKEGSKGCALVGDPHFYERFGFRNYPELVYEGIPQEFFMALPFEGSVPEGIIYFHEGFHATE